MSNHRRFITAPLVAATAAAGLALTAACGTDNSSTPAPTGPSASEKTQQEKKADSSSNNERADLTRFRLDDRSQAGITDIWVVWTVKNTSGKKSNYQIDWEAVDSSGTRVANSTELVTDVQPGQTSTGEDITTLHSTQGIKLNITRFDRTAAY
ncbi:hypothetical protein CP973_26185 [Streptomyces albofaciens JCM 4342]|uniref:hypothetical protein n=1 Tax=Streptomyces albofaciens TaxID=66866 RepID=UPI0012396C05|nr:hypothetical protein [Streptomyces albofaciens]KAA6212828.1 hypothetical protein CP973_26185 [Streptomyces albofaciens JCM 4342]